MKELFSYFLADEKISELIKKEVSEIDSYDVHTTLQ